ncbi:hypothetical protein [Shewanella atlantica]|uniref:Uncharacterized protein n=1 Tax=Shewanella atlantica TaxID=271099 RepID=A0A3S0K1S7_9GAMM|nr:hypothetical protein [Shewanella atlantica]RTR33773.1 hypothetical protein EKG39_08775 [Shewanella atlantica]
MTRRYLILAEAKSALSRNKEIEIFLGGFQVGSKNAIRWASFSASNQEVVGNVWEALDEGSEDYLDIYSFSPVSGEWDEPVKSVCASSLEQVLEELRVSNSRIVNSGIVQDEYASYLSSNT